MLQATTQHAHSVHEPRKFEPPFVYVTTTEAMQFFGVKSKSTWNYLVRNGEVPAPYKIGKRLNGYRSDEIKDSLLNRKQADIMEVA